MRKPDATSTSSLSDIVQCFYVPAGGDVALDIVDPFHNVYDHFQDYLTVLKSWDKSFSTLQKLNVFVVTYLMFFAVIQIPLSY